MLVELAVDHFVSSLHDQLRFLVRKFAEIFIDERGGLLENAERANHLARHPVVADIEVMQRALRLSSPISIGGTSIAPIVSVSILVLADCSGDCCTIVEPILPQKGTKSTNEEEGKIICAFCAFLWLKCLDAPAFLSPESSPG